MAPSPGRIEKAVQHIVGLARIEFAGVEPHRNFLTRTLAVEGGNRRVAARDQGHGQVVLVHRGIVRHDPEQLRSERARLRTAGAQVRHGDVLGELPILNVDLREDEEVRREPERVRRTRLYRRQARSRLRSNAQDRSDHRPAKRRFELEIRFTDAGVHVQQLNGPSDVRISTEPEQRKPEFGIRVAVKRTVVAHERIDAVGIAQFDPDRRRKGPEPAFCGIERESRRGPRRVFVRRMDAALVERPVGAQVLIRRYADAHIAGHVGTGKVSGAGRDHHDGPFIDDRGLDRHDLRRCRCREPAHQHRHGKLKSFFCLHSESPSDGSTPARGHSTPANASPNRP